MFLLLEFDMDRLLSPSVTPRTDDSEAHTDVYKTLPAQSKPSEGLEKKDADIRPWSSGEEVMEEWEVLEEDKSASFAKTTAPLPVRLEFGTVDKDSSPKDARAETNDVPESALPQLGPAATALLAACEAPQGCSTEAGARCGYGRVRQPTQEDGPGDIDFELPNKGCAIGKACQRARRDVSVAEEEFNENEGTVLTIEVESTGETASPC